MAGTITGADVAGIVARMDGGTVENCVNKATVTGNRKAAGIVVITKGSGEATIQNCKTTGPYSPPATERAVLSTWFKSLQRC